MCFVKNEHPVVISHRETCPCSNPNFVPIEGKTFCNCDIGERIAKASGLKYDEDKKEWN